MATLRNSDLRYGVVAQAFHWVVAVLVLIQLGVGAAAADMPLGLDRLIWLSRHKSLGVTILILVVLRMLWRWANPAPPLPLHMAPLERRVARLTHWLFYALLVSMPIAGWLQSSASNLTVSWFGLFLLPDLVAPNERLASTLALAHRTMAWMLVALVCLHVIAAFRHQLVLRDDILMRMVPRFRRFVGRDRP